MLNLEGIKQPWKFCSCASLAALSRVQEAATGFWHCLEQNQFEPFERKKVLCCSHTFSPLALQCAFELLSSSLSWLPSISLLIQPHSCKFSLFSLATCGNYKWGTMGFCDGNADPTTLQPLSILCCCKAFLGKAQLSSEVSRAKGFHPPCLDFSSIIDHPTCPNLLLTGERMRGFCCFFFFLLVTCKCCCMTFMPCEKQHMQR